MSKLIRVKENNKKILIVLTLVLLFHRNIYEYGKNRCKLIFIIKKPFKKLVIRSVKKWLSNIAHETLKITNKFPTLIRQLPS